ncbi:MAG: AzlC family ABC transporter permease [Castellaniella sp.]
MKASPSPLSSTSVPSLTLPVAMGYVPLGAVFGFLFVQADGPGWLALLASLLIYAGAAQYMMIPMLVAGLPLGTIALATLVINLRHVFYGLSLLGHMPARRWQRWYCIFALTDETYSVLTALPVAQRMRHMVLLSALNQGWWVLGTALGVLLGAHASLSLGGLDFVLTALFAVLAVEQWRRRRDLMPIGIALLAYVASLALMASQALAVAIALCSMAAALRPAAGRKQA